MARFVVRTFPLLMLAVVGLAVTASAQSMRVIKVSIPFEFNFGKQQFPAGEYTLVQSQPYFLLLRDSRGRTVGQLLTKGIDSSTPAAATELKFDFSEGQHRLIEVWREQDSSGERLYLTKSQNALATQKSVESDETAGGGRP